MKSPNSKFEVRDSRFRPGGVVLVMIVFVIAMVSAIVIGILEVNTEEIQLMQNHINVVQALVTAEAGLNAAYAQLRLNSHWTAGFSGQPFNGGSYTVTVNGSTIRAVGTTSRGSVASMEADVTLSSSGPPYAVAIDAVRINE
jgi:type II secretory pathway component PulK